jgi:predicted nucleic acid-binding Zn ribbon protein
MTRTCHNPKCGKPAERKFCSTECQRGHARNRRRDRRNRQSALRTLHSETTSARYLCIDCHIVLTPHELATHDDEHLAVLHDAVRRCRNCQKPVTADDPYCDDACFVAWHYRAIPGLPPGMSVEDIVYSEAYSLLHGLTGFVPYADDADAFSSGLHVVNLRKDHSTAESVFVT